MTRKTAREIAMHIVFENSFSKNQIKIEFDRFSDSSMLSELDIAEFEMDDKGCEFIVKVVEGVFSNLEKIDQVIEKYSADRKKSRISSVSLALLRIAIFEILFMDDVPEKVSVNEAVELAKKYDSEEMPAYINGILGSFLREGK